MGGKVEAGKKYLSHTLAEWACGLRYEDLSQQAIQSAKLFWYDSLGCPLGGSQQEAARILLAHYQEMAGTPAHQHTTAPAHQASGPCTCFVSGFKTNPVDAALINDHMIRAMDYNDIYWKA